MNNHLVNIIKGISINSCPYKINLHCHTTFSDGSLSAEKLVEQACSLNLSHIAITDHHSIDAFRIASKYLALKPSNSNLPKLWSGIEISCILNKCLVHILGYGFDINSIYMKPYITGESPLGSYLDATKVIDSIKLSGGVSVLAHPARYRINYKNLIDFAYYSQINGIEVWYDYEMCNPWKPTDYLCDSILKYSSRYNLLSTCGTDTHGLSLLSR